MMAMHRWGITKRSRIEGGGGAPAVSAYPCNHDHSRKDMHRSRIYLGTRRASKGGAMTSVIRPDGTFIVVPFLEGSAEE